MQSESFRHREEEQELRRSRWQWRILLISIITVLMCYCSGMAAFLYLNNDRLHQSLDSLTEHRGLGGPVRRQLAQNGVAQQDGIDFSSHEGFEASDFALFSVYPFAVRSRQPNECIARIAA